MLFPYFSPSVLVKAVQISHQSIEFSLLMLLSSQACLFYFLGAYPENSVLEAPGLHYLPNVIVFQHKTFPSFFSLLVSAT